MNSKALRIQCLLDWDRTRIRGRLVDPAGSSVEFEGWAELAGALMLIIGLDEEAERSSATPNSNTKEAGP